MGRGWSVLGGVNVSGDGEPDDTVDRCGHGTWVSCTIRATEPRAPLVPIRVVSGGGVLRDPHRLELALAWVADHRMSLGMGVVCMALGDASHRTDDLADRDLRLRHVVAVLRDAGVPTVVAAGSRAPGLRDRSQGSAWPAVLREVVSVGAAEVQQVGLLRLAPRTRRLHASSGTGCSTTVFAVPGPPGGTSGAAAVVAGRLATLRERFPNDTVDELVAKLVVAAQVVTDAQGLDWACLGPGPPHDSLAWSHIDE